MNFKISIKHPRFPQIVALLLAGIGFLPTLRFVWHRIKVVRGWEADAVAKAIVNGQGFSFPGSSRWLWEQWKGDPNSYFPTAWVDPVYTYLLAAAHWLFGNYAYFAIFGLCFVSIAVILLCAYLIAARFGSPWIGVLAVALIAFNWQLGRSFFDDITNSALAASAILATALVAIRYFENPTSARLVTAGLATGFTVLTCPAAQYFPILFAAVLVLHHFRNGRLAITRPLLMLLCATAVVAPWTIRNYVTFGEFVLVRSGAGQIAWDGVVGPAETFMPGAAQSSLAAPWQSSGPREAVRNMLNKDPRIVMHEYQVYSLMASPVPGYQEMNEAQRDKLYLARTKEFIKKNPGIAAEMAIEKINIYVMRFGAYGLLTLVLAIAGALLTVRNSRGWPLSLLALSYSAPFILIIAYYGRYRGPIEPVFAVLAAIAIGTLVSRWRNANAAKPASA